MRSAVVTPVRNNNGVFEVLVCIGAVGAQTDHVLSFGGAVDAGETLKRAAVRELEEESGMRLNGHLVPEARLVECDGFGGAFFPQYAGGRQIYHYYVMVNPGDRVTFTRPSHEHETKAVDVILGVETELREDGGRSRVAWVPKTLLEASGEDGHPFIFGQPVFENFLQVVQGQFMGRKKRTKRTHKKRAHKKHMKRTHKK